MTPPSDLDELILQLAEFSHNFEGFLHWAFPWGQVGELEAYPGPEDWQRELARQIDEGLLTPGQAVRIAIRSGHGIGKSAFVSMLILWAMSTCPDTIGVITANTETQLKTKTWVQLAKWYRLFIGRELFKFTATALFSVDPEHEKTWRFDMVPWSERNTEAFAGLHNQGKRILLVFDEASAIPDVIYEVAEGALTDKGTEIIWFLAGNPTQTKGRFIACFPGGQFAHRWRTTTIDSRSVTISNKEQIAEWAEDFGEDSDFFRVRVRGLPPRVDFSSFITMQDVRDAQRREIVPQDNQPLVLGVDVARFGDNFSVIYPRRGRDARSIPPRLFQGLATDALAAHVAHVARELGAVLVFVDGTGVGGGVVDRLRTLNVPVVDVQASAAAISPDGEKIANKRTECWLGLKKWMKTGALPLTIKGAPTKIEDEISAPTYTFNNKDALILESKKDMRARGVGSPDIADALSLTFALPVVEDPQLVAPLPAGPAAFDYDPISTFGESHEHVRKFSPLAGPTFPSGPLS